MACKGQGTLPSCIVWDLSGLLDHPYKALHSGWLGGCGPCLDSLTFADPSTQGGGKFVCRFNPVVQHNTNSPAQGLTLWPFPKKLPYPHWDWIGAVLGTVKGIH